MYGRLNLALNGAFAIQNEVPAIQISSIFSTDNTNFIIILPHLRLNTGFSAGSTKFSTCNTKGTHN